MLIKNPEALKSWLVVVLEPICDADSSALARYVLALLKKDKPEKELKKVMIEQLDVFLAAETKVFVERLFNAINTDDYLNPPAQSSSADKPEEVAISLSTENLEENVPRIGGSNDDSKLNTSGCETTKTPTSTSSNATVSVNASNDAIAVKSSTTPSSNNEIKTKESQNNQQKPSEEHPHASHERPAHHHSSAHKSSEAASTHAHGSSRHQTQAPSSSQATNHVRSASPPVPTNADKENQPREGRRRRASLRSRSRSPRSRSRSTERTQQRRSRSPRDRRANDREKFQRQFRNRSPVISSRPGQYDRRRGAPGGFDRRRIGGGGVNASNRGNNSDERRSPRFTNSNNNNSVADGERKSRSNRSHSRSRSPSAERTGRANDTRDAAVTRSKNASNNSSNALVSIVRPPHSTPERMIVEAVEAEKRQRCRDFDEKGYCVRGETCPWDHGVNPVVFDGGAQQLMNIGLPEYNPDVPDMWGSRPAGIPMPPNAIQPAPSINPFSGAVRPGGGLMVPLPGQPPMMGGDYPRMAGAPPGFRGPAPMMPFGYNPANVPTQLQRELIPIPVVDAPSGTSPNSNDVSTAIGMVNKRRFDTEDLPPVGAITEGPTKRKLPINSRLGPRVPSMQNNCSLELRKVPRGLNSITHLNNHFVKFGKIVNIQISYDGDPEAAIVTFSTHAEANVAYRSTEAVLNNRFIKVFWHNQDTTAATPNSGAGDINRKNNQYHLNKMQINNTVAHASEAAKTAKPSAGAEPTANAVGADAAAANANSSESAGGAAPGETTANTAQANSQHIKSNAARASPATNAIIRKKQEEQAKAVAQLASGLRKRKQELLQSYLKQMKSAVEIVERCEANDPQRAKSVETIRFLQESIDKLRKEIASEQVQLMQTKIQQSPVVANPKKTKEQQKKELLDIELELIAQQQEGNDTSAIQKRLEELQRSLGIIPGSGKMPHYLVNSRPVPRPRPPQYGEVSTRVDRRPKTIVVTGFVGDDADAVLGHFKHFGEITKHDVDREIPQLILSYSTRNNAERAFIQGRVFKEKRLQITWAPTVQTPKSVKTKDNKESEGDEAIPDLTAATNEKTADGLAKQRNKNDELMEDININAKAENDLLPELRLEDEEDDDDFETRWRR